MIIALIAIPNLYKSLSLALPLFSHPLHQRSLTGRPSLKQFFALYIFIYIQAVE